MARLTAEPVLVFVYLHKKISSMLLHGNCVLRALHLSRWSGCKDAKDAKDDLEISAGLMKAGCSIGKDISPVISCSYYQGLNVPNCCCM